TPAIPLRCELRASRRPENPLHEPPEGGTPPAGNPAAVAPPGPPGGTSPPGVAGPGIHPVAPSPTDAPAVPPPVSPGPAGAPPSGSLADCASPTVGGLPGTSVPRSPDPARD